MENKVNWELECKNEQKRAEGLQRSLEACQKHLRESIEYYAVEKYRDTSTINNLREEASKDAPSALYPLWQE